MPLVRQADADAAHRLYVENARWEREGVLFATVHVPGSDNNRPRDAGDGRAAGRGGGVPGPQPRQPRLDRRDLRRGRARGARGGGVRVAVGPLLPRPVRAGHGGGPSRHARGAGGGRPAVRPAGAAAARRQPLLSGGPAGAGGAEPDPRSWCPGRRTCGPCRSRRTRRRPSRSGSPSSARRTGRPARIATDGRAASARRTARFAILRPAVRACAAFGQMGEARALAGGSRLSAPPARANCSRSAPRRGAALLPCCLTVRPLCGVRTNAGRGAGVGRRDSTRIAPCCRFASRTVAAASAPRSGALPSCVLTVRGCAAFGQMGEARASAGGV